MLAVVLATMVTPVKVGLSPCAETAGLGSLWVANYASATVTRVDPATNRVVQRIHTGGSPTGLAVSNGSLWVGSNGATDRRFFRISLRTGRVTTVNPGCLRPAYFAVHPGDDPWVTCVGDGVHRGSALRIDPKTNRVLARVPVGHDPGDGAIDGTGRVWIPNKGDGTVSRIDPGAGAVAETVPVGGTPFVTIAAFGDVWVPDYAGATIDRLR